MKLYSCMYGRKTFSLPSCVQRLEACELNCKDKEKQEKRQSLFEGGQISGQNLEFICHFNGEGEGEKVHLWKNKRFLGKTNRPLGE